MKSKNWYRVQPILSPPDPSPNTTMEQTINSFINATRMVPSRTHAWYTFPQHKIGTPSADNNITKALAFYKSPPIIATDAGRKVIQGKTVIIATMVLCAIDLRKHDPNKDTQQWEQCACHLRPLLARQRIIPESIGWDETNVNTGEAFAHLLVDQTLPLNWCALIATDSNNAKSTLINLLKEPLAYTHRYRIRKLYSPMSKTLMTLWQSLLNHWHDTDWPLQHPTQWNLLQTLLPTIQK